MEEGDRGRWRRREIQAYEILFVNASREPISLWEWEYWPRKQCVTVVREHTDIVFSLSLLLPQFLSFDIYVLHFLFISLFLLRLPKQFRSLSFFFFFGWDSALFPSFCPLPFSLNFSLTSPYSSLLLIYLPWPYNLYSLFSLIFFFLSLSEIFPIISADSKSATIKKKKTKKKNKNTKINIQKFQIPRGLHAPWTVIADAIRERALQLALKVAIGTASSSKTDTIDNKADTGWVTR